MKALVIYDSIFGNTEKIAQTIADALGTKNDIHVMQVDAVKPTDLQNLDVLVVGSPTRGFSPTPAIKTWVTELPKDSLKGVKVAAFDTRIAIEDIDSRILSPLVRLFGYAAKPIGESLKRKGGELVAPPEGFYVQDREGPLKDGEINRATEWAHTIVNHS